MERVNILIGLSTYDTIAYLTPMWDPNNVQFKGPGDSMAPCVLSLDEQLLGAGTCSAVPLLLRSQ